MRLAQFLFGDAPDFDPQIGSVEHDVQRIWRELSFLGFWRVDAEDRFERLASQHVDARVVLGQDVFAVRAEAQMSDVAPQRWLKRRLRGYRMQGFFAAQPRVADDGGLPARIFSGLGVGAGFDATGWQRLDALDHLAQALRFRAGHAEKVGEEIARLALRLDEAVEESRPDLRVVAGGDQREESDPVGFDLIFAFVVVAAAKDLGFARGVFDQEVVLIEDVATVRHLRQAERFLQPARHAHGLLARHQVTYFVRDHGGQLIFALREGDHLARDVNATSGQHKRVGIGQVDKKKLEPQLGRRQMFDDAFPDAPQMACDLVVVNHSKLALNLLGNGVAQIDLLLFGENVRLARKLWRRRPARLLGIYHCAAHTQRHQQEATFKQNLHGLNGVSNLRIVDVAVCDCLNGPFIQGRYDSWKIPERVDYTHSSGQRRRQNGQKVENKAKKEWRLGLRNADCGASIGIPHSAFRIPIHFVTPNCPRMKA